MSDLGKEYGSERENGLTGMLGQLVFRRNEQVPKQIGRLSAAEKMELLDAL